MPLTTKKLRDAKWTERIRVPTMNGEFITHASDQIDGLTVSHDKRRGKRTRIIYTVRYDGRQFDSPSEAVRHFNQCEKVGQRRRNAPGYKPTSKMEKTKSC